jgi:glutathione S-transferase
VPITLYYRPGTAAMAPHMALEEAGARYQLALVDDDGGMSLAEYRSVNPLGRVPTYVDDGLVLWEAAAVCVHIADTHPAAALLPPLGSHQRALAMRWLIYLTNTVQATFMHHAYPHRLTEDEPAAAELAAGAGRALDAALDHIDSLLGDGPHLLGEQFTVADLYLFMVTRWCRRLPRKAWSRPHVGPHYARMAERPAVARALAQEGIEAYPDDW